MAAGRKPDEGAAKAVGIVGIILGALSKFASAVFSLSVHSYFLWSSLLFLGCGLGLTLTRPRVNTFLCQRPTQKAEGGPGCEFCRADILMCPKDQCYQDAVNITWQTTANTPSRSRYQAFMQAATDTTCNTLVEKHSASPVEMIVAIHTLAATTVTAGCIRFHCGVLKSALGDSTDLARPDDVCDNVLGTKADDVASTCMCGHLLQTITATDQAAIDAVCGSTVLMNRCPWGSFIPAWCGMTTTTASTNTTVAASGGASARRLPAVVVSTAAPSGAPAAPHGAAPGAGARALAAVAVEADGRGGADAAATGAGGCGGAAGAAVAGTAGNTSLTRSLQAAAPSASETLNDVLEDWTVGEWSKCSCLMQCIPGVKTRLVQCLAARCKTPEPANKERCVCPHCASCSIVSRMFLLSMLFFGQGGIAFILYLCYLHATTVKEEHLIKISILRKLVGMFCKNLPVLVRLLILCNVFFALFLVGQTYSSKILNIDWHIDCFESADLRLVTLIVAGICLFQLCLGQCAKRLTRKPPWLFSPERLSWPTPIRLLIKMFRSLGP